MPDSLVSAQVRRPARWQPPRSRQKTPAQPRSRRGNIRSRPINHAQAHGAPAHGWQLLGADSTWDRNTPSSSCTRRIPKACAEAESDPRLQPRGTTKYTLMMHSHERHERARVPLRASNSRVREFRKRACALDPLRRPPPRAPRSAAPGDVPRRGILCRTGGGASCTARRVSSAARRARKRRAHARPRRRGRGRAAHGRGATGRGDRARGAETKRRNARATAFRAHAARRQNAHSSATPEATPANPGRPGQPIAMARSPAGRLEHRPGRVPAAHAQQRRATGTQAGASRRGYNAREGGGGGWCMWPQGVLPIQNPELSG